MLNLPCCVAVNNRDEIAVSDFWNHCISVYSNDGTHIRTIGRIGWKNGELIYPIGVAFDSLGNIVVVDSDNHRVQVFDESGNFLSTFGEQGSLDHQLNCPAGLSITGDGDFIVADTENQLIKIFSPSGEYLSKFGGAGSLVAPYHCIQHCQYLIVSDWSDHSIKMFDLEGTLISKFGKKGDKDGEFIEPRHLSINKEGFLMVCDGWNNRVQLFELNGEFVTKFGSKGSEKGEFRYPHSTANLSDGRIVLPCLHSFCLNCLNGIQRTSGLHGKITCPECRRQFQIPGNGNPSELPTNVRINSLLDVLSIKKCSTTNAQVQTKRYIPVLSFGQGGESVGMLNEPWGVAVNDHDVIVVTEILNHRVSVFRSDGTYLRSFGKKGQNKGEFAEPSGIAFDSLGNIVVTDCENHRVQVFDRKGKFLRTFGQNGILDHQLKRPEGLSINGNGDIIVTDKGNKLIKIFSSSGEYLRKFGGLGSLVNPYHCIQHGQYFIVTDYGDDSIKMFDLEGKFISKFGKRGNKDGEFNQPSYLSVNKEGLLMVCDESNHRVQVFELTSGKFVTKFGSEGSGRGEFIFPVSTASLSDGRIVQLPCLHSFCLHCLNGIQRTSGLQGKITCPECKRQFEIPGSGNPSELPTNVRINSLLDVLSIKECSTANVKCGNCDKRTQKLGVKRTASSEAITGNKRPNVRDSPLEVQVQTRRYIPVLSFGREGKSVGMLKGPWGVAVNDHDEIAVAELLNHRVSVFSSDGTHLRSFGCEGQNNGEFNQPSGIAFDSLGNIVVTDCKNHRVQVFDRNGKFLHRFGEHGSLDHQLLNPAGLSINGNCDIIVTDVHNQLIKIFSSSGEYLCKFGGAGFLVEPYHCIQHGQYFIVSDYGDDSIKMFDLEGKFIS
ncbi:unnamed protein product [Porites evermanni]|uniref:RING-type domain-containing protein n=1 Tax=Porites evermanni TaxID=104178 RepID=A0ABN8MBP2_9CNID|nr:unnamed protein product [Porites evermanni]